MKYGLYAGLFLFLLFTIVSIVRCIASLYKLNRHIREKHTEKWKYLTTLPGFGPGCKNDIRMLKFVFGKDDLGDPEVLRLKVIVRNSIIYHITGIVAVFIMSVLIMLFHAKP